MYGNQTLPGVSVSETYRVTNGSIWQGYPESTFFKTVKVNGTDGSAISAGTIMKELTADGSYTPITVSDIVTAVAELPGARLAIVADKTAKTGTTTTVDNETEATPSTVLVGTSGTVNKEMLFVGDTKFGDLTEEQQICLNTQLEAWNFQLVNVVQA